MDRFDVVKFEDLTGPQGQEWVKIGGGSFGVVFRGEYLGTEVAIKEVLPNNTYDVEKYFERECVLMKEARHPNIVQYIGLTKNPAPNGRIYIISEFVGGNLRSFIADKRKAFDWPLRVSFATDIARAVAYLHARNCLHRDLKGENLLITANDRIKVCDFGFARIAARNEEEMRRISYCGTDGYMSPEILMGIDFSLPSDIFSLGIIFCEIISRHLVDANTFKRQMPTFGLDEDEVRKLASKGCPPDLVQLSIDCCQVDPLQRPDMRQVVKRLRAIEQHVMQEELKKGRIDNVGSLRGSSLQAIISNKKKNPRPIVMRLPSFEGQVKLQSVIKEEESAERSGSEGSSSDDDMEEALKALEHVNIGMGMPGVPPRGSSKMALDSIRRASSYKISGHGNPWWDEDSDGSIGVPSSWVHKVTDENVGNHTNSMSLDIATPEASPEREEEDYSTSVIRPSKITASRTNLADTLDRMTEKINAMETDDQVQGSNVTVRRRAPLASIDNEVGIQRSQIKDHDRKGELSEAVTLIPSELITHTRADSGEGVTQSFMTARSSHHHQHQHQHHHAHIHHDPSLAMATLASSIYEPALLYHRFTLVKNGMKRPTSIQQTIEDHATPSTSSGWGGSLMPAQLILANALTKCNVCTKRLGFGAYMDCDDCPYKTHVGCAAMAEPTCQEMQIPFSGGNTPVLTPVNASRRGSVSASPPTAAAIALAKAVQSQSGTPITATASAAKKDKDAKSPPNTVSRGVNLFRRRNSKSPPPKVASSVKV